MTTTKDTIIDAAIDLIMQKGATATSLNAICQATGLTKGAFFHYFKSKDDLIKQSILRFSLKMQQSLSSLRSDLALSAQERLWEFFNNYLLLPEHSKFNGCVIGICAQELAYSNTDLQTLIGQAFAPTVIELSNLISEVAREKSLSVDSESLARFWLVSFQGALLVFRGIGNQLILREATVHYRNYLFNILQIKDEQSGVSHRMPD